VARVQAGCCQIDQRQLSALQTSGSHTYLAQAVLLQPRGAAPLVLLQALAWANDTVYPAWATEQKTRAVTFSIWERGAAVSSISVSPVI
jgi:hypothetical protein